MEVSLRKPQRLIYQKMIDNPGCYLRSYKKTVNASRIYWRLMTHDHSPIVNITSGNIKPFFQLSLLKEIEHHQHQLKDDVVVVSKKKKKDSA